MLTLEVDGLLVRRFRLMRDGVRCGTFGMGRASWTVEWDDLAACFRITLGPSQLFPKLQSYDFTLATADNPLIATTSEVGWLKPLVIDFDFSGKKYRIDRRKFFSYYMTDEAVELARVDKADFWARKFGVVITRDLPLPVTAFFLSTVVMRIRSGKP
jgi:hypothetical protein